MDNNIFSVVDEKCLKKLIGTLKNGRYLNGFSLKLLIFGIVISTFCLLLTIPSIIVLKIDGELTLEWIIIWIIADAFFLLFLLALINRLNINTKMKRKLQSCILDGDIYFCKGHLKRVDVYKAYHPQIKKNQIAVTFNYEGKMMQIPSSFGNEIIGYDKIFLPYDNKDVNMIYSPKNDEVFILKD